MKVVLEIVVLEIKPLIILAFSARAEVFMWERSGAHSGDCVHMHITHTHTHTHTHTGLTLLPPTLQTVGGC